MHNQKTYSVIAGRIFSDTLLDIAFVLGVVGTALTAFAFLGPATEMAMLGKIVGVWLLGMTATVLWGACALSVPAIDQSTSSTAV